KVVRFAVSWLSIANSMTVACPCLRTSLQAHIKHKTHSAHMCFLTNLRISECCSRPGEYSREQQNAKCNACGDTEARHHNCWSPLTCLRCIAVMGPTTG